MIVTVYDGAADPSPRSFNINAFADLSYLITEHAIAHPNEKDKTPIGTQAFNGCEFDGIPRGPKDSLRSIDNVVRVHFGMVDIDKKPLEHVQRVLALFDGIPTFAYSTYSHGHKPGVSMRLVFPFSRPVRGDEWQSYMAGFQALTDKIIDTEKDPTRLFFVPVRRPERGDHFLIRTDGPRTFDVDACIKIGKSIQRDPAKKSTKRLAAGTTDDEPFTIASLKDVAATLRKSGKAANKEVATIIDHIVDGTVYSKDGERDAALFRACGAIARYFPNVSPETIAPLFERSIGATNAFHKNGDDHADLAKVVDKLTRNQERVKQQIEAKEEEESQRHASDIRTFFARYHVDRDTPYDDDELDAIKREIGAADESELRRSWIVQNGSSYYRLGKFGYLPPVGERALVASCRRDLAPASGAGVSIYALSKDGEPLKRTPLDLMIEYGTVANGAVIDLTAQASYYDRVAQKIIEAPCPLRKLEALTADDPITVAIESWLRALAGDEDDAYDKLRRWVAFVTRLDSPCVALYLEGDPGTGKSLLAKGLSRLWTTSGAPSLGNAIGTFNTGALHCPLIVADETMPDELRGKGTTRLREFQQNTSRMINRKNIPMAECVGAIRLILAANNKHMIETREALTLADVHAIAERVLYFKASARAKEALSIFGKDVGRLVTDDLIARYALYLANLDLPVEGRFMIPTEGRTISKSLTVHAGDRPVLLHWLISYLQNPTKYNALNNQRVLVRDGTLYVQTQALVEGWETYVTNAKAPQTARIADALKAISHESKTLKVNKRVIRYYPIRTEILYEWAIEHGISSQAEIDEALAKPTAIASGKAISVAENPFETKAGV